MTQGLLAALLVPPKSRGSSKGTLKVYVMSVSTRWPLITRSYIMPMTRTPRTSAMSRQFELDLKSWRRLTEDDDSPHDSSSGPRNLFGGVRRFTRSKDDGFGTGVREGS